jgi:hypothetical protein
MRTWLVLIPEEVDGGALEQSVTVVVLPDPSTLNRTACKKIIIKFYIQLGPAAASFRSRFYQPSMDSFIFRQRYSCSCDTVFTPNGPDKQIYGEDGENERRWI